VRDYSPAGTPRIHVRFVLQAACSGAWHRYASRSPVLLQLNLSRLGGHRLSCRASVARHRRAGLPLCAGLVVLAAVVGAWAPAAAHAAGTADTVSVALSSSSVTVGGTQVTVTATARDAYGNPVPGDTIEFTSNGAQTFASPSASTADNGMATVTLTSSDEAGTSTITATDNTSSPSFPSDHAQLTQLPGPATQINVSLSPATALIADGSAQTSAIATVLDRYDNPVPGDIVSFASSGGQNLGPTQSAANGTYSASITSTRQAGTYTITATDSSVSRNLSAQTQLVQRHGPPHRLTVALSPPALTANGIATTRATVLVTDVSGNPVAGDHIRLTCSDRAVRLSHIHDGGNGAYTATVTSSNVPRTSTLTASDTTSAPTVSSRISLVETPAPSLGFITTMQWSFYYAPSYTLLRRMSVSGVPSTVVVSITFRGSGCPGFPWRLIPLTPPHCPPCARVMSFLLMHTFANRALRSAVQIVLSLIPCRRPRLFSLWMLAGLGSPHATANRQLELYTQPRHQPPAPRSGMELKAKRQAAHPHLLSHQTRTLLQRRFQPPVPPQLPRPTITSRAANRKQPTTITMLPTTTSLGIHR